MRALFALAILALASAGSGAARAADVPVDRVAYTTGYVVGGVRAGQFLILDHEPGVLVRAYWRAPWRNRHYFPRTGKAPKFGRREVMFKGAPKPAKSFYREWWTSSAIVGADVYYPEPETRDGPPRPNDPLK